MKVNDAASRATVSQLDAVPGLQADLKSEQQVAANNQTVINQQTQQIISDKDTITQNAKTCTDEKNTLKAQNKKSFWTGFKWGIGVGIGVSATVVSQGSLMASFDIIAAMTDELRDYQYGTKTCREVLVERRPVLKQPGSAARAVIAGIRGRDFDFGNLDTRIVDLDRNQYRSFVNLLDSLDYEETLRKRVYPPHADEGITRYFGGYGWLARSVV